MILTLIPLIFLLAILSFIELKFSYSLFVLWFSLKDILQYKGVIINIFNLAQSMLGIGSVSVGVIVNLMIFIIFDSFLIREVILIIDYFIVGYAIITLYSFIKTLGLSSEEIIKDV